MIDYKKAFNQLADACVAQLAHIKVVGGGDRPAVVVSGRIGDIITWAAMNHGEMNWEIAYDILVGAVQLRDKHLDIFRDGKGYYQTKPSPAGKVITHWEGLILDDQLDLSTPYGWESVTA